MISMRYYKISVVLLVALAIHSAFATVVDTDNFSQRTQWPGEAQCTKMVIVDNGQMFCAQKKGTILLYPSINAQASEAVLIFDDEANTYTWHDKGMVGMAVHPSYPDEPYVWAFYSVNQDDTIGNGPIYENSEECPDETDYCSTSARLVRIRIDVDTNTGVTDQILMQDWCGGSGSHQGGDIIWSDDNSGMFLASGDGSAFSRFDDFGVEGTVCYNDDDARDQGCYRAQWDDYVHGKILFFDLSALLLNRALTADDYRIIAKGLRNPFRLAIHPNSKDMYVGDVGSDFYEEINLIPSPLETDNVMNFGWPCYEGLVRHPTLGYRDFCDTFSDYTEPWFVYERNTNLDTERPEMCNRVNTSPSALAFRTGTDWGSAWENVLFWADGSLRCVFYFDNSGGVPDSSKLHTLAFTETDEQASSGQWIDLRFGTGDENKELYALDYYSSTMAIFTYSGSTVETDATWPQITSCVASLDDFSTEDINSAGGVTSSNDIKVSLDDGVLKLKPKEEDNTYTTTLPDCFAPSDYSFSYIQIEVSGDNTEMNVNIFVSEETCGQGSVLATTDARLWGGFSTSEKSFVTIPLSAFDATVGYLHSISLSSISPVGDTLEVSAISLIQACGVTVATFEPTLCTSWLDKFETPLVNLFGGATTASDEITVVYSSDSANLISLSTTDSDAVYSSQVFNEENNYCVDLSFYDSIEIEYYGDEFTVALTSRLSDCSSSTADTVSTSSKRTVAASSASTTATIALDSIDATSENVHSVEISGISGTVVLSSISFTKNNCNAGVGSSNSVITIIILAIVGGLLAIGVGAFMLRRRRVDRGAAKAGDKKEKGKDYFFDNNGNTPNSSSGPRSRKNASKISTKI